MEDQEKEEGDRPTGRPRKQKGTCWGCGKVWFYRHDCLSRRGGKGPRSSNPNNDSGKEHLQASSCETCRRVTSMPQRGGNRLRKRRNQPLHEQRRWNYTVRLSKCHQNGREWLHLRPWAGTLTFSTTTNGEQTTGELKDVYYIPERLVSLEIPLWLRMGFPSFERPACRGKSTAGI
jgi:hypothetical protein